MLVFVSMFYPLLTQMYKNWFDVKNVKDYWKGGRGDDLQQRPNEMIERIEWDEWDERVCVWCFPLTTSAVTNISPLRGFHPEKALIPKRLTSCLGYNRFLFHLKHLIIQNSETMTIFQTESGKMGILGKAVSSDTQIYSKLRIWPMIALNRPFQSKIIGR